MADQKLLQVMRKVEQTNDAVSITVVLDGLLLQGVLTSYKEFSSEMVKAFKDVSDKESLKYASRFLAGNQPSNDASEMLNLLCVTIHPGIQVTPADSTVSQVVLPALRINPDRIAAWTFGSPAVLLGPNSGPPVPMGYDSTVTH